MRPHAWKISDFFINFSTVPSFPEDSVWDVSRKRWDAYRKHKSGGQAEIGFLQMESWVH
jgi:hypothetical protein